MRKVILVTSCKGGVGKSTIAANLGMTFALSGKRTLVCDCDFGMRCLDLIMGLEDRVVYDLFDVLLRGVPIETAAVWDIRCENLFLLAGPYRCPQGSAESISRAMFRSFIDRAFESLGVEYIVIDTPGDIGIPLVLAACAADAALIVATQQPASIRAAGKTSDILRELGVDYRRMIINSFDFKGARRNGRAGVIDIIDKTYVQLIGIIPYDSRLETAQSKGVLIGEPPFRSKSGAYTDTAAAFRNIADRLASRSVPLFSGFRHNKRYDTRRI